MDKLAKLIADPESPEEIFRRLCEGERFGQIAKEKGLPKGRFHEWFMTQQRALYELARMVRAEDHALAALDAAMSATPQTAAVMKLRSDVLLKLASRLDREHNGDSLKVERDVTVKVDVGLLGTASELLGLIQPEKMVPLEDKSQELA